MTAEQAAPGRPRTVIRTARLTLREMTLDDLDFVAAMLTHPEVMRHYPARHTREEARRWIERQQARYARDGHGLWLAEDAGGRAVGQVGLVRRRLDDGDESEIAYLLHRPFWGHGYATEAAAAVRDHAFETLGRERVIALIRPANRPSRRVAQRVGLAAVGRRLHHRMVHVVYALSRAPGTPASG